MSDGSGRSSGHRSLSSFQIHTTDYQKVRKLGHGSYGRVDLVSHRDTGEYYAMKLISTENMSADDILGLKREIEILAKVKHGAVLSLRGYQLPKRSRHTAAILTDYMANGSVEGLLRKERKDTAPHGWNLTTKFIVLIGVAAGMQYLHGLNIIHRDLKPGNILLDAKFEPFIGDFGFSKFADNRRVATMSMVGGTPLYMAPELYESNRYGFKVDVYAYGMMMFEILTMIEPFEDITNPNSIPLKVCSGVRPEIPKNVPKPFKTLIQDCWAQDPEDRPSFDDIVERLLSVDFNFPKIMDMEMIRSYEEKVVSNTYVFSALHQLSSENQKLQKRVDKLEDVVKDLVAQNQALRDRLDAVVIPPSPEKPSGSEKFIKLGAVKGIVAYLSTKSESPFDRKVALSQSSCDIYELINPDSSDKYVTAEEHCENYIQFEFKEEMRMQGIRLTSSDCCFLKSWRLVAINEDDEDDIQVIYETTEEKSLNEKDGEVVLTFDPVTGRIFRIEQTGTNWEGGNSFSLRNVEFKEKRSRYHAGVFRAMLEECDGDPHQADVLITSNNNDHSDFYLRRNKTVIRTFAKPSPSWIQIEFIDAVFHIEGYRMRCPNPEHRKWVLKATDDISKDMSKWTVIEPDEDESEIDAKSTFHIVKCISKKPYQYFRLILDEPRNDGLEILHFDLFGLYEPQ